MASMSSIDSSARFVVVLVVAFILDILNPDTLMNMTGFAVYLMVGKPFVCVSQFLCAREFMLPLCILYLSTVCIFLHKVCSLSIQIELVKDITREGAVEFLRTITQRKDNPTFRKLSVQVVGAANIEDQSPPTLEHLLG